MYDYCVAQCGFRRGPGLSYHARPLARITGWSTSNASCESHACACLNETAPLGLQVVTSSSQSSVYYHIDDTAFMSGNPDTADQSMNAVADRMSECGHKVGDRSRCSSSTIFVGDQARPKPARLEVPDTKDYILNKAMLFLHNLTFVDVDAVSTILGVWVWLALLRRDLLAIPNNIFAMTKKHRGQRIKWWPSALEELRCTRQVLPLMLCHLDANFLPLLLATDAMGSGEFPEDHGGYGVVASPASSTEMEMVFRSAVLQSKAIVDLSGNPRALKVPDQSLSATRPAAILPDAFFDESRWYPIRSGRWRASDHITLGETRAYLKMMDTLILLPSTHSSKIIAFQDIFVASAAAHKGRSVSIPPNFLLRKKASRTLAASWRLPLPWIDTTRQPADRLSRDPCASSPL